MSIVANLAFPLSIKKRFLFSVGANIARAAVSLIVGLMVARGLGPADYGNLAYLLGSFWAVRALLDMGASSAFYTFIAQRNRGRPYYLVYFGWLAFQFILSVALVTLLLPSTIVERFWLGQERETILLALLATFLQNQVWQTVVQMHEAERMTIRIQVAGMAIIVVHLLLVALMLDGDYLSIQNVLLAIIVEHLLVVAWMSRTVRISIGKVADTGSEKTYASLKAVIAEYVNYCKPMLIMSVMTACYEMVDRWLLQRYGGAIQQGFFQVASQLSTISLLATTSILNILWKEVAEACEQGDRSRVIALYQKTTRFLVLFATIIAAFLVPWAEALVVVLLGPAFRDASIVLSVMLFYPIHQAMGQVNGILFLATGRTYSFMTVTVAALLIGMPVTYVLITPPHDSVPIGFGLGAVGIALKTVVLNLIFVNVQSWMIARYYGVKFQWRYQVSIILGLMSWAYAAKLAVQGMFPSIATTLGTEAIPVVLIGMISAGTLYLAGLFLFIFLVPGFAGLDKADVMAILNNMKRRFGVART